MPRHPKKIAKTAPRGRPPSAETLLREATAALLEVTALLRAIMDRDRELLLTALRSKNVGAPYEKSEIPAVATTHISIGDGEGRPTEPPPFYDQLRHSGEAVDEGGHTWRLG